MKNIFIFLAAIGISFSALGQEAPWSGFSFGLKGGLSKSNSNLENRNSPSQHYFINEGDIINLDKNSTVSGIFADYLIQSNDYVYGIEMQHTFNKINSSTTAQGLFDNNTYKVSMKNLNAISAKAGYLINKESLVYFKAGLGRASFTTKATEPSYQHTGTSKSIQNALLTGIGFNELINIEGEKFIIGFLYENYFFRGKTHSGEDLSGYITQYDVNLKSRINILSINVSYKF